MKENQAPESYPIQFKDKIDEYLWKEHRILGGCCSSVESMKYAVAREVGYWNLHGLSVNVKLPRNVEEGDKAKVIVIKED